MLSLETLPSGLFGYKKTTVCEYIAQMNEDFSRRSLDKEKAFEAEKQQLQERLAALEQENAELRMRQGEISRAVLDAHNLAAQIKANAERDARSSRDQTLRLQKNEEERIQALHVQLEHHCQAVRDSLSALVQEMEQLDQRGAALLEELHAGAAQLEL